MLSDKPMKGLSDTLPATHLALCMMIITLHQLLVFVNVVRIVGYALGRAKSAFRPSVPGLATWAMSQPPFGQGLDGRGALPAIPPPEAEPPA
jgi:hypothetical protein